MVSCSLQTHITSKNVFIACQSPTAETEDPTTLKAPPPPSPQTTFSVLLLCILLLNMLHKYKSEGFGPSKQAGHNPLFTHIILHQYNPLNSTQYISGVSCCTVLLQGTRSLIMGLVFKECCQNMCNTSVWICGLGGVERPSHPSCAKA